MADRIREWTAAAGITAEGSPAARAALRHAIEAVRVAGPLIDAVMSEAKFRVHDLPRRAAWFQRAYLEAQGEDHD